MPDRQSSVWTTFALEKNKTCPIPTQHIKGIVIVSGFHASAKYLTLRHFSHFGMKKLLGTGARTVRGCCWEEIRKLAKHSLRLSREILWSWACICNAFTTTTSVTEVIPHIPSTCHIFPCCIFPRILNCVCPDAHYTPACHQHREKSAYVEISGLVSAVHRSRGKKEKSRGLERWKKKSDLFCLF